MVTTRVVLRLMQLAQKERRVAMTMDFFRQTNSKQDQVNNANSAFIFMINLLIIQGCQSGSVGRGDQLVRLVRLIWWSR